MGGRSWWSTTQLKPTRRSSTGHERIADWTQDRDGSHRESIDAGGRPGHRSVPGRDVDRTLLRENLRRTVQERVDNLIALQQPRL